MAKADSNLIWQDVDLNSLTDPMRKAYDEYKVASRAAAVLREAFENMINKDMPQGQQMVFNYRFGKLSAAITEAKAKAGSKAKAPVSLSQFIKIQQAAGARN